jgi:hypothetical protein
MTALPSSLARWEEELSWVTPTLAPALGRMLPRLALAIGPLARSRRDTGEPDGYGRIARRGPFDRMLASQWALLDEVPEDFLRRASSNELLFFELARSEPHGSERSIALFDAGPYSIGLARLAHLALFVVLARRAREANVPFFWSTLREPHLRPFVGEASVRAMLDARTPFRATEATFASWREQLGISSAQRRPDDEIFVVGDEASVTDARASLGELAAAVIEDGLLAPHDQLNVTITRARREPRRLSLPLPDDATRVRLLRDPFRVRPPLAAPPVVRTTPPEPAWRAPLEVPIQPEGGLVFSRDGRKILVRTAAGIAVLALPEVGQSGRVLARHATGNARIVAAGTAGRRVVTISQDASRRLHVNEMFGGARDLDSVDLRTTRPLAFGPRLCAAWLGMTSPASRKLDLSLRTRMGLLVWSDVDGDTMPDAIPANAIVPLGSGAHGFALAARRPTSNLAPPFVLDGYACEARPIGMPDAYVARAPDDSLVLVRQGRGDEPLARARALIERPPSPIFAEVLDATERHDGTDPLGVVITEHIEGLTLTAALVRLRARGARVRPVVAAWLARELARAVHSLAVLGHAPHGGLRPERVHLAPDGRVRVQHALDWPVDVTEPMPAGPEVAYLAPEQVKGLPIDFRADVYSIGLVLHELLSGRHATELDSLFDRLGAIARGRLVDLGTRVPDLQPELHAIVRTATALEPELRFASARALCEALDAFLAGRDATQGEVVPAFALDEEPTTRRVITTPWDLTRLVPGPTALRSRLHPMEIAPAWRVVVGGTPGGAGLLGFVEAESVRVMQGQYLEKRRDVRVAPGAAVIGVCALDEVVVRRPDSVEIRNGRGVLAAFPVSPDAELVMCPGWPHLAVLGPPGGLEVISLSQRRVVLVAGAGT